MGRRVWGPGGRCVSRAILGTGTVPASFRDPLACLPRPALVQRVQRGTRQAPEDRRPGKRPGGPRGQRVWLLVPEGCGCGAAGPGGQPWPPVLAEPPGRDGARALPGGGGRGGRTQQLPMHKGGSAARLALDLNGVQFAGIHYRLSLTRCLPLEKRLHCTVGANVS